MDTSTPVVDLSTPPKSPPAAAPSLADLATTLDGYHNDIPGFVNSLVPSSLSEAETTLNTLLTRLSILSQDTSSALEQSIHDITRTVPRLTYDLQFMRESATSLQSSLSSVQTSIRGPALAPTASLDRLSHLDKLKSRMESARDILREAESWSTLESEITSLIQQSAWTKAGTRLAEASRSMVVFQSTPGEYESRRTLLVSLQNQLEGALAQALSSTSSPETLAKLRPVFEMIDREDEFKEYYFKSRRQPILDEWTATDVPTLPRFYSALLSTVQAEKAQIPLIFPSPTHILSSFIQTTLECLDPSPHSRLAEFAEGSSALPDLIKAYKATEELASAIAALLDTTPLPSPSGPETPKRPSRRFSRAIALPLNPAEWETTLYEPFLDLQTSYPALERRFLANTSIPTSKTDPSRALLSSATAAFATADEAIGRCLAFTHGYGAVGLVDALNAFFDEFLASQQQRALTPTTSTDELDFDSLDYSTEDWGAFQLGLHVLSACKDIRDRLEKFESKLKTSITLTNQPTASLGALTLLQQSPLNSAALQTLLANPSPLAPTYKSLAGFTRASQQFLQNIILAPLQSQLKEYSTLSVWSQPDKAQRRGDLQVPTFSLSPTDTIARVSEGLLNLLRVFEVYATDDALAFSIETLPFVDKSLFEAPIAPEVVLSTWVSSLSLSLLSQMTTTTLRQIRTLSNRGAAQLASDLAYLSNAVRALDVEWDDLERWKEASGVESEEEYRRRVRELPEGDDEVWRQVGVVRGWA
ncbi:Golgi complex component 7-domain-containing protein [Papiliotrema laurentii]|uniref:Conserved oligomeric Golgi complex subunit 7 n=1 Tax=Papiliotrema laurentii TaxID=5418 RepID=A0AAD9L8R5_PAPLA|nr:Golgi complex component 7-domain-containing protein [Papiliotrema laurentii]